MNEYTPTTGVRSMAEFIKAWHGCLEHGHNHCPDCRTCNCY